MLHLARTTTRLAAGSTPLRGAAAAAAAAVQGCRGLATEPRGGPGLPGQKSSLSEEEVNRMGDRPFQGDKVEDAPKPKSFKPEKQQPAAEDINQGTGAERVQTPTSAGREGQDSQEPVGGPM